MLTLTNRSLSTWRNVEDTQPIVELDLDPPTGQTDSMASTEVERNKADRRISMTDLSWRLFHVRPQKTLMLLEVVAGLHANITQVLEASYWIIDQPL